MSLEELWATTALLASAMPVGINAYVFAKKYQVCESIISSGIVLSVIGCTIIISIILAIFEIAG